MTLAIDRKTGAVLGQALDAKNFSPAPRMIRCYGRNGTDAPHYFNVDAASVRLERTED